MYSDLSASDEKGQLMGAPCADQSNVVCEMEYVQPLPYCPDNTWTLYFDDSQGEGAHSCLKYVTKRQ
jgi:hypothetical protein